MPIVIAKPAKVILEDFESYTTGAFFPNANWTLEQGNANWLSAAAGSYAPLPTKHLSATITTVGESYITYNPTGTVSDDGTVEVEFAIQGGGDINRQGSILLGYVDTSNFIAVRFSRHTQQFHLIERVAAVNTTTSVSYTFSENVVYYMSAVVAGTSVTGNIYSDLGRTNLLTTVNATVGSTPSGKIGLAGIGNVSNTMRFDNFTRI